MILIRGCHDFDNKRNQEQERNEKIRSLKPYFLSLIDDLTEEMVMERSYCYFYGCRLFPWAKYPVYGCKARIPQDAWNKIAIYVSRCAFYRSVDKDKKDMVIVHFNEGVSDILYGLKMKFDIDYLESLKNITKNRP